MTVIPKVSLRSTSTAIKFVKLAPSSGKMAVAQDLVVDWQNMYSIVVRDD